MTTPSASPSFRRRALGIAVSLVAVAGLAACSDDDSEPKMDDKMQDTGDSMTDDSMTESTDSMTDDSMTDDSMTDDSMTDDSMTESTDSMTEETTAP